MQWSEELVACEEEVCFVACQCLWVAGGVAGGLGRSVLCGVSVSLSSWWRGCLLGKKECALWRVNVSEWLVACAEGVCFVACQCLLMAGGVAGGLCRRSVLCGVSVSLSGWWLMQKECALWRVNVSEWLVACAEGVRFVECQCLWVAGGVAGGRTGDGVLRWGGTRRES